MGAHAIGASMTPAVEQTDQSLGERIKQIALIAGPLLFLLMLVIPLPTLGQGDAMQAPTFTVRVVLGLTLWMAAWWMTEAVNLAVTSLLPLLILPVFGVVAAKSISGVYFQDSIVLFLGGFCLALAMERSGLHRRIAFRVVRVFGTQPRMLVLGFLVASAVLSMWVSNTATSLMLIPVALTVASAVVGKDEGEQSAVQRSFIAACILAVAYGASIGGVGTLIGTPPNVILASYVSENVPGVTISFGRWMMLGLPLVIVITPIAWLILTRYGMKVPRKLDGAPESSHLLKQLAPSSRMSFAEGAVMAIFFVTALMWITHGEIRIGEFLLPLTGWDAWFSGGDGKSWISDGTIAIFAAILLMVLPSKRDKGDRLLPWEHAQLRLPWGTLLLFGGGLALAQGFNESGLNEYLTGAFGALVGAPIWLVFAAIIVIMTLLSELASNTAATSMTLPVLFVFAGVLGIDPMPILIAGTLGASSGYMLPVATPPNAVAFGTGKLSVAQMIRAGVLVDVAVGLLMWLAVMALAPVIF